MTTCTSRCSMFWCFVFFFTGIAMLGCGIWMAVHDEQWYRLAVTLHPDLMENKTPWRGTLGGMLALGCYCFVFGILGMGATGANNRKALIAFTVFGSIGIVGTGVYASLVTANYASTYGGGGAKDRVTADVINNLKDFYKNENSTDDFTFAWNKFQTVYNCCGIIDYTDYRFTAFHNATDKVVPWSCCMVADDNRDELDINNVLNYEFCMREAEDRLTPGTFLQAEGCGAGFTPRNRNNVVLLSVTWVSTFLQIFSMIVSGVLRDRLKVDTYTWDVKL